MADKEFIKEEENATAGDRGAVAVYSSLKTIMIHNFLGGLAWGFGTILGATIVVALVIAFLSTLDTVPIIGDFISRILDEVSKRQTFR